MNRRPPPTRLPRRRAILAVAATLALAAPAVAAAHQYVVTDGRKLSYPELEQRLAARPLPIVAVEHREKSEHAATLRLTLEGGLRVKFRMSEDIRQSRRNEDPKLFAASYVVSRYLFPEGGPVMPTILRAIPLDAVLPHLDDEAAAKLTPWAREGQLWGAISPVESGGVRAQDSRYYGGHLGPDGSLDPATLPLAYLRSLSNLNVVGMLTHNGDLHGDNWEIREDDGSCFILDSGISFTYDGYLPYQTRLRKPCEPLLRAHAASTMRRLRALLASPGELDRALARLQGTPFGLPEEARSVVQKQARQLLACWKSAGKVRMRSWELEQLLRIGDFTPFRESDREKLLVITDW